MQIGRPYARYHGRERRKGDTEAYQRRKPSKEEKGRNFCESVSMFRLYRWRWQMRWLRTEILRCGYAYRAFEMRLCAPNIGMRLCAPKVREAGVRTDSVFGQVLGDSEHSCIMGHIA